MPKRKGGPDSELMIRAAVEGGRAAQEGREAVLRTKSESADQISDIGKQLIALGERSRDREFQAEEAQKDRSARSTEATKERAFRGAESERDRAMQAETNKARLSQDQQQFEASEARQAAAQGLEQVPGTGGGAATAKNGSGAAQSQVAEFPGGNVPDVNADPQVQQRLAQTQADMQRGEAQRNKPAEFATDGKPRFVLSEAKQQEQQARAIQAETALMREQRLQQRNMQQYQQLQAKQDEAAQKEMKASLMQPLKASQKLGDAVRTGALGPDDDRWGQIAEMVGDNPSPDLMREVEGRTAGPHLARFLSNRQAMQGLSFTLQTGDMPDADVLDASNPIWQKFHAQVPLVSAEMAKMGIGDFVDVRSQLQKMRMVNKAAAKYMVQREQLRQRAAAQGASVDQSQQPSAGGSRAEQRYPPR